MDPLADLTATRVDRPAALTIGVFDGVHTGHRYLMDQVRAAAKRDGLAAGVVTFRNHPATVLAPHIPHTYLCSVDERLALLRDTGVDYVVPVTFTKELSQLRARDFVDALVKRVRMKRLLCGPDFALGKGREGTVPVLESLGREMGFAVEHVKPLVRDGMVISSTAVREALKAGNIRLATSLLGRRYRLNGPVVKGDQRGRTLGFPTANIAVDAYYALPADGIYATVAHIDGKAFDSATNIGVRPTFGVLGRTVEAYIMDFSGDLYGKHVDLEIVERLRPEERFASVDALIAQMHRDVAAAR
ncbi:MAG: bifunctional riboflavin kinase/FAD synthetase [Chloroflexi bacterium]|nr:bifunctional riboflavin kinase/FAD synthetase [Chloroflexota bacterium]